MIRWSTGALLAALFLAALAFGSVPVSPGDLWLALTGRPTAEPQTGAILLQIRFPRALAAALAGAALALAGLQMQTVFRNPLADPYILGVSSGASLGVALVLLAAAPFGAGLWGAFPVFGAVPVVVAASLGAGAVLALILGLTRRVGVTTLLIVGIMIAYLINAFVSLLLFFALPGQLQEFLSWSFGRFDAVPWPRFAVFGPVIAAGIVFGALRFKSLDALLLGEDQARLLGENTRAARFRILGSAALLAGTVTAFCGPIGFLGVAVPHLARGLFRTRSHRVLVPQCLVLGACLALFADLVARFPGSAATFPLNAVTAFLGAPVILVVLLRGRKGALPA